jgi:UDP-3-O-[3-hydroxymyristoyl] N-acetylglucosamine deacetylase
MYGEADFEITGARARTLRSSVTFEGIGLHRGKPVRMTLLPAPAGTGIHFRRIDLLAPGGPEAQAESLERVTVKAHPAHVVQTTLGTVIGNAHGVTVATIEHLMAALAGLGVDDAIVELDGPEVPIMDGSAAPFLDLIERSGVRALAHERKAWRIDRAIRVELGDAWAEVTPLDPREAQRAEIEVTVDYADPMIGRQALTVPAIPAAFRAEIAAARTFCYLSDVEAMRAKGLALGGSLDNAIVVDGGVVLNEGGLRCEREFVRHKALDLIGDLHLLCRPLLARVTAYKPGHALNTKLAAAIAASADKKLVRRPEEAEAATRARA